MSLILSILLSFQIQAKTPESDHFVDVTPEIRYQFLKQMISLGSKSLPSKKSCDFKISEKEKLSFANWVAWNISFFESKKNNSIEIKCQQPLGNLQKCRILFNADTDSESPWNCGFQFQSHPKTHKIDFSSLECTGSC